MNNLPIIDISILKENKPNNELISKIVLQINEACTKWGFFYISGHGINTTLQTDLENLSAQFFELPEEEKMEISMQNGGKAWRGYFPLGNELTSGKPDQKEGLYFGTQLPESHPKVKARTPLHGLNLFPKYPNRLESVVLKYMEELTQVGHLLMRGISLSLGLPENYFHEKYTSDPLILFRIFHYPTNNKKKYWGVGEHTDYGLLTILRQDEIGGLQVKSKGEWIDAPPIKNTFVCNIGDMLDKMTGGLYRSTPHRVLNTSGKSRFSFPLFFDPGFDTHPKRIEFANTSHISDNPEERWDKTSVHQFNGNYGKYILGKVTKAFPYLMNS